MGLFDWDVVRAILGTNTSTPSSAAARAVYVIVGIAGLALAVLAPRLRARRTTTDFADTRAEARA
ncbi:MAG TPA: DUF378 domain-containing protein [Anaeromyxobacteraceae bacterium]|nr:DUF378 domain-containing protein [Anaeromyxobacteraceae bacterium]